MIHFGYSFLLGNNLCEIKEALEQFESFHLGLYISDLTYSTEKEGIDRKKKYYENASLAVKKINGKIRHFNSMVKESNKDLSILKEIDLATLNKIIMEHKGDYPKSTGPSSYIDEIFGRSDSPAVLSRKHTALLLRNLLVPTKLSIADFGKSVFRFVSPFESINKKKVRKSTRVEIDKIEAIYSIGGLGESIFLIGRLLENIINQYLNLLKKRRLIDLRYNYIKSDKFTFENKIDYLYSKKFITPSQFSKMKSVKWDRNLYGHNNRVKPKDASAMVVIGLQGIEHLEYKYERLRNINSR